MSWNYRIIKKRLADIKEDYYFLSEVFYERDGTPMAYADEIEISAYNKDEIIDILEMMLKDAKKYPVINEKEFFKNDNSK